MPLRRRDLLALPLALSPALAARAAEPVELSFWSWRQEDRAFYQKAIETFRKTNPGISVTFTAFEPTQYPTILSTALAAGKGPDVMQVRASGGLAAIAAPGYLMKLDRTSVPDIADYPTSALDAESAGGALYAVPFATQTMLVIYNKDVFASAGVAVPADWVGLQAVCKTLKDKGITPFANGTATAWQNETLTFSLLSSLIGKAFVADVRAGKADFTDQRFTGALAKLDAMKEYLAPNFSGVDYASAQQLFIAGRAAMFAGGSFELANFLHQNPKMKLDVFAAPGATSADPKLVAVYYDGGYAINAKTEKREAALAFLRYLASPAYAADFANTLQNISPCQGVKLDNPLLAKVAEMDGSSIPYLMLADYRYHEPNGSVLLQAGVQKMLAGQATPQQVGADVTKGIATYDAAFRK
jgi:raffinose/stachyose/melibiose transport system substrate-binding protein